MTIEEVVGQVLRDEHGDVIGESVGAVAQELMEAEISELIGAQHGKRSEDRATHRNGYRPRRWDTRAGDSYCRGLLGRWRAVRPTPSRPLSPRV